MSSITLTPVESSQIEAIGHDPESNTLAIRFKAFRGKAGELSDYKGEQGALYHYANVTTEDFEAFRDAESIGRHFKQVIKPDTEKFPFTRIDESKKEDGDE